MKRFLALPLLLALAACADDNGTEDTQAPSIISITLNGEDHDLSFQTGETIQLQAEVSDNEALGELKIDLHDLFDGHDHGKTNWDTWSLTKVLSLSGTNTTASTNLVVPDSTTAGPYHAILRLLDQAGNEAEYEIIEFAITNGTEPQISISQPDFSAFSVAAGQNISLVGSISDETDLEEVSLIISEEEEHSHKSQSTIVFSFDEDLTGSSDTSYDLSQIPILIPSTAEAGHYIFFLQAKDSSGNYGIFEAEIEIE